MNINWNAMVREWITRTDFGHLKGTNQTQAREEFIAWWEDVFKLANQVISGWGQNVHMTADELAHAFLTRIKEGKKLTISSRSLARKEMVSCLMRKDQASSEIFDIARTALLSLEKQGTAFRQTKPEPLTISEEIWWAPASAREAEVLETDDDHFQQVLEGMESLPPPAHAGRKLVSPTLAKEFILKFLSDMKQPVFMRLIQKAFYQKSPVPPDIVLASEKTPTPGNNGSERRVIAEAADTQTLSLRAIILRQQILERAQKIGEVLCEKGLCLIFTNYYIPKKLEMSEVRLEDFGATSTVYEKVQLIEKTLRTYLPNLGGRVQSERDVSSMDEYRKSLLHLDATESVALDHMRAGLFHEAIYGAADFCKNHCLEVSEKPKSPAKKAGAKKPHTKKHSPEKGSN